MWFLQALVAECWLPSSSMDGLEEISEKIASFHDFVGKSLNQLDLRLFKHYC